jgi:N-methylhydantoinase A
VGTTRGPADPGSPSTGVGPGGGDKPLTAREPAARLEDVGRYRIGIDIGGTFTDALLSDGTSVWRAKSPTTPDELGVGVLDACRLVAERAGLTLDELMSQVGRFGLGTTAVTNALAERKGRRIGLIVTAGFEDEAPHAKGKRVAGVGGWVEKPRAVVTRRQVAGVRERIDREGRIVRPLDTAEVVDVARHLVEDEGAEAVVVSFLWAFKNPVHERNAVAAIRDAFPDLYVESAAELNPIIREFERTSFAVFNAYVGQAFQGIDDLGTELARLGLRAPLLLVQSAGGALTVAEARRVPINLAFSGPAAGVAAGVVVAQAAGVTDALTYDMGGTSTDVSLVTSARPSRRTRGELFGIWTALPFLDVESIGAGGGSIAWIDVRRMLRVGPQSAGSVPGPVCYARGGTEPTLTDALLVLGYLHPDHFLGGTMELDLDGAIDACAQLGADLGLGAMEVAWGIRELALEGMTRAVRSFVNGRGVDPGAIPLVTYGGCGALFGAEIAKAVRSRRVLVPGVASVLSAFGAATADIRRERLTSIHVTLPADESSIQPVGEKLIAEVRADLAGEDVDTSSSELFLEADLRFRRQVFELSIPLAPGPVTASTLEQATEEFMAEYVKRYGNGSILLGMPVELVNLRAVGIARTLKATLAGEARRSTEGPRRLDDRTVHIERTGAGESVPVYVAAALSPGESFAGPAIVEADDTTIWVPDGVRAGFDDHGTCGLEVLA